jgi:hypothetical protein
MAGRLVVFRVSDWFCDRINEYCKERGVSYAGLFNKAIERLCEKYLKGGGYEEGEDCGEEDREQSGS